MPLGLTKKKIFKPKILVSRPDIFVLPYSYIYSYHVTQTGRNRVILLVLGGVNARKQNKTKWINVIVRLLGTA